MDKLTNTIPSKGKQSGTDKYGELTNVPSSKINKNDLNQSMVP